VVGTREHGADGVIEVRLEGPAIAAGRIAVDDLVLVAGQIQKAVERIALVLRGEQGLRPGRLPREVAKLTRLEVVSLRPGSVILDLALATGEHPLQGMDLGQQALKRLVDGLAGLSEKSALPVGWDAGVLLAAKEMGTVLRRGIERIYVELRSDGAVRRARVESKTMEVIGHLVRRPVRHLRTLEGRLLMADFRETATRCRIHPPLGPPVECTFDEAHRQAVLDALTRYVRVSGEAQADQSTGRIRLLEIADIEVLDFVPSSGERPYPFWERVELEELARTQGVTPVEDPETLAAPVWESDEELEEFLEEIYRARRSETG
jgi:hypothetical protein